jgi:hypothetical protein
MANAPVEEDPLMRHQTTMKTAAAMQAIMLVVAAAAQAVTLSTPPLHPDANGRLSCTVVNVGGRKIAMAAEIVGEAGDNVTDFAATEWSSGDETVPASMTVESSADAARYCKVVVTGGGRSQVRAALEAFDQAGTRTAVVEAH